MNISIKYLKFLDRFERWIFGKYNENHEPVSSFVATIILVCAAVMAIVGVFKLSPTIVYVALGLSFLVTAWKAYPPLMAFATTGAKVGFGAYILVALGSLTVIFLLLATAMIYIVVGIFALYLYLSLMYGDNGKKKKTKARYSDGTTEELIEERGLMGERYYKGKDTGNEFMEFR